MVKYNMTKSDMDEHKRKIFIQHLAPETTKQSLEVYFSKYAIDWCAVPQDNLGKNKSHGIVTFHDQESVDAVMSERPHIIDGKEVFLHRAVPEQKSAKDSVGVQQLIVTTSLNNQSLVQSDIEEYFDQYGNICNINKMSNDENDWIIDFDDYDIVDKICLDSPHRIGETDVSVRKCDRNGLQTRSPISESTLNNNKFEAVNNKFNLKQRTITEQMVSMALFAQRYRVRITNLPMNIDAETLSNQFEWHIYDIVIDPSSNNKTSQGQCWLKNPNNEREVDNFVQQWNRKVFKGSVIQCEKEEDELELCNKFQYGQCSKSDEYCHWEHIKCPTPHTCSPTCPYGHKFGMKSKYNSLQSKITTNIDYRIKLTGFKTELTPQYLTEQFGSNNYYIDSKHKRVGYVVKIKTMKYARQLMIKWHNSDIDGQKIKCQLELNPVSLFYHNRPQDVCSLRGSEDSSDFDDTDKLMSISSDNRKTAIDHHRLSNKPLHNVIRFSPQINLSHANSLENITTGIDTQYQLPSDVSSDWEVTRKAPNSDGKVLLIRNKIDRKRLAVIKVYPNQPLDDFYREITVMKDLKGINGVSQLIEPEYTSNNLNQRRVDNNQLWMIMKRAPGCSLKEFIERKCQGVLEISTALKLTLNLIEILQRVHDKGILHQNLSPENIMIEWDFKSSMNDAQLTIMNFNQALFIANRRYIPVTSLNEKWYRAPQINEKGFISTVDASACCAILFWLLTQINPCHGNTELPHQQAHNELDDMIKSAVKSTDTNRTILLEDELKRYLMDTFDRAFGFPYYHPWPINDLKCRLEFILELLQPIDFKSNTIDTIFQQLISVSNALPISSTTINDPLRDVFETASKVFCQAKSYFLENRQDQYEWSDGGCAWIFSPHNLINECYHDDILTYRSLSRKMITSYSIIIRCLANCIEQGRVIILSIGTNMNGKTIQMPIGQYSTAQDYSKNAQENFIIELQNLLLAVYKEQHVIEHS